MRYRPFHITSDSKYKAYLTNSVVGQTKMCNMVLSGCSTRFSVIVLFCYVSSADQSVKPNWNYALIVEVVR